jgi:UDP-sugar transporter A1/2/3
MRLFTISVTIAIAAATSVVDPRDENISQRTRIKRGHRFSEVLIAGNPKNPREHVAKGNKTTDKASVVVDADGTSKILRQASKKMEKTERTAYAAVNPHGHGTSNIMRHFAPKENRGMDSNEVEAALIESVKMALIYDAPDVADVTMRQSVMTEPSFFKVGMVVITIFASMVVYTQTHEVITHYTGLQLTYVYFVIYAGLSVSIDLSIKNVARAYGGNFPFHPASGVVVVESFKLLVSAILFALHAIGVKRRGETLQIPTWKDVAWLAIPAGIYATNNLIVFQAIKSTPLATFAVVRETILIWNALIWMMIFKKPISAMRWLCFAGIFLGCSLNQIPRMFGDTASFGVLWSCLLAFTNAAGAVANEYAMKQKAQLDINLQNSILYFLCGSFVLIGIFFSDRTSLQSPEAFFTGFVPECWIVIILQAFAGLAASRVLKYLEAVTKTIAAAICGPAVIILGAVIFHTKLHPSEVSGTLIVCFCCGVYLWQGPLDSSLTIPLATKTKHLQRNDKLCACPLH